jgi:hypothetical protein
MKDECFTCLTGSLHLPAAEVRMTAKSFSITAGELFAEWLTEKRLAVIDTGNVPIGELNKKYLFDKFEEWLKKISTVQAPADSQERLIEALETNTFSSGGPLSEIERLRRDCAEAYQVIGAGMLLAPVPYTQDDVARALDNLSAAANGDPRPHDDLLPWPK